MQELFGLSMNAIMIVLLAIFVVTMAIVFVLGLRNRVVLKMGLRPIPRRPGQTVLIIFGVMAKHRHHLRGLRHRGYPQLLNSR